MSFSRRRFVPLYVVVAMVGVAGSCPRAVAEPAEARTVAEADTDTSKQPPANGAQEVEAIVASEQVPAADSVPPEPSISASPATTTEPPPATAVSPPPQVAAPFVIDVPGALDRLPSRRKIDRQDRDGLITVYRAREGRPIWMTPKGATAGALKAAAEIAKGGDWGLDASAFQIPVLEAASPDGADLGPDAVADAEVQLSLAVLKYARHARGGRFEPTDITPYLDRKSPLREPASVLEQIAKATEPDAYLRKLNPQNPQFERLRQRYLAVRGEPAPRKGPSEAERILANMEQWRWMPDDLGAFHIWVNIPEQLLRVVRDGRVIHTERIVVGKPDGQTPIFSNEMKHLIFHPFWGVPDSIKINEILPGLRKGRSILARQGLRLQLGGKDVDPSRFDWNRTDIRRFHVYQPPGRGNALGAVKFMFPNKHAVYMHDTPSKSLFKASVRAFSHGCMRVQHPVKFAELILAEDQGMSPEQVRALAGPDAPENNQINLSRHIPVHMVYFTMRVEDSGKVSTFKDIYGHEERIRLALAGRMNLIKPVPEPKTPTDPIGHLVEATRSSSDSRASRRRGYSEAAPSFSTSRPDWARRIFSDGGSYFGGN